MWFSVPFELDNCLSEPHSLTHSVSHMLMLTEAGCCVTLTEYWSVDTVPHTGCLKSTVCML
jgi:hypothetical protein